MESARRDWAQIPHLLEYSDALHRAPAVCVPCIHMKYLERFDPSPFLLTPWRTRLYVFATAGIASIQGGKHSKRFLRFWVSSKRLERYASQFHGISVQADAKLDSEA